MGRARVDVEELLRATDAHARSAERGEHADDTRARWWAQRYAADVAQLRALVEVLFAERESTKVALRALLVRLDCAIADHAPEPREEETER